MPLGSSIDLSAGNVTDDMALLLWRCRSGLTIETGPQGQGRWKVRLRRSIGFRQGRRDARLTNKFLDEGRHVGREPRRLLPVERVAGALIDDEPGTGDRSDQGFLLAMRLDRVAVA